MSDEIRTTDGGLPPENFVKPTKQFQEEMHSKSKEIDPDGHYDWFHLTYGWALGKGMGVGAARSFALFIRYDTDLG